MAGYSNTPLVKKLGVRPGDNVLLQNTPDNYHSLIDIWPEKVEFIQAGIAEFIHYFTQSRSDLERDFPSLKSQLLKGGMLWISWPKGKSELAKDLNENDVREIGLKNGLVDVKVCAVDEDWSGLKFMYRTKSATKI